jgi:hypothetical protein
VELQSRCAGASSCHVAARFQRASKCGILPPFSSNPADTRKPGYTSKPTTSFSDSRLEAAFTGSQDGRRYIAERLKRASDGGIFPPIQVGPG